MEDDSGYVPSTAHANKFLSHSETDLLDYSAEGQPAGFWTFRWIASEEGKVCCIQLDLNYLPAS